MTVITLFSPIMMLFLQHQEATLELVMTTVLHSVSYYGWHATISDINTGTLLLVAVHSQSEKLSITSKPCLHICQIPQVLRSCLTETNSASL